jgi:WD40 repeat protein
VARHRLVGVFGASGAGKSSLLRAGLIPRLRDGNPHRRVVVFTPGADPLLPCANRLAAVTDADPDKTREALTAGRHGLDAFIREWSAEQPAGARPLATITGHTDVVYTLAISPDGRTLATGSGDHTTRLWNIADPRQPDQIATLTGHSDTVRAVAFSPDGRTLATGSADHTARLWSTDPEQIAARICREATPAITAAEWEHYFPNVTYQPPCPS